MPRGRQRSPTGRGQTDDLDWSARPSWRRAGALGILALVEAFRRTQRRFHAGQAVSHEGTRETPPMTIFSVWAVRYRPLSDGRCQVLNCLPPGDVSGLQQALEAATPDGVEALTDRVACVFDRRQRGTPYAHFPRLAHDVTWLCTDGELIVDESLVSVGQRRASARIAMLPIHLNKRGRGLGL